MKAIRLGIIGVGAMGRSHAMEIQKGSVSRCQLTAVCDADHARLQPFEGKAETFTQSTDLIRSGCVDAVLIATPHYDHASIAIESFANGLHVLTEKPIAVHKADCERAIAASRQHPELRFAAMFQMRTAPLYLKLKRLIDSEELGAIRRVNWIITNWFRTEAYYASGGWRATWGGEGGGVLLNQCPHNLDLFQWFFGMPVRVHGFCHFGKHHNIEVEDDVTAYMEFADGKTAVFIASTGDAPGTDRLEITAERGRVIVESGAIRFDRNEIATTEFNRSSPSRFDRPETWQVSIPLGRAEGSRHMAIVQNFVDSALDGSELLAPAAEGIHSVELANAILYSTFTSRGIELPLDGAAYEAALKERIASSTFKKVVTAEPVSEADFEKSFR